MKYARTHTHTN